MKVAIIDDEPLAVDLLSLYVSKTQFLELVGTYNSAVEAIQPLNDNPVDLVFLDIQMPEMSGLDLARKLPQTTMVIFTTAFDQYAVESYRVNTVDYLLKPISYDLFLESAQKAWKRFSEGTTINNDPYLYVKSDYKRVRIFLRDILYVEGLKDYVKIHLVRDEKEVNPLNRRPRHILSLMSLKTLEEFLPNPEFMRVHRSYIVHMPMAQNIDRQSVRVGSVTIPISESYKEAVFQYVSDLTPSI